MGATCSQERPVEKVNMYDKQRMWTTYSLVNRDERELDSNQSHEFWPGVLGFDREVIRLDRGCCADDSLDQTYGIPDVRVLEDDDDPEPTAGSKDKDDNRPKPKPAELKPTVTLRGAHDDIWFDDIYDATNKLATSRDFVALNEKETEQLQRMREERPAFSRLTKHDSSLSNSNPDANAAITDSASDASAAASATSASAETTDAASPDDTDDLEGGGLSTAALLAKHGPLSLGGGTGEGGAEGETGDGPASGDTPTPLPTYTPRTREAMQKEAEAEAESDGGISPDEEDSPAELIDELLGNADSDESASDDDNEAKHADDNGEDHGEGEGVDREKAQKAAAERAERAERRRQRRARDPRTQYRIMMAMLNGMSRDQAAAYDRELRVAERAARKAQRKALAASLGMTEEQVVALAAEVRDRERAEKLARLQAERAARRAAREEVKLAKQTLREAHHKAWEEKQIARALAAERARQEAEAEEHRAAMERLARVAAGLDGPAAVARETYDFSHIKFGILTEEEKIRNELKEEAQTEEEKAEEERRHLRALRRARRLGLTGEALQAYLAREKAKADEERRARRDAIAAGGADAAAAAAAAEAAEASDGAGKVRRPGTRLPPGFRMPEAEADALAQIRVAAASAQARKDAGVTGDEDEDFRDDEHAHGPSHSHGDDHVAPPGGASTASAAAISAVVAAETEALSYEAAQQQRAATEAAALAKLHLPPVAQGDEGTTHLQVAPKGRVDPAKEVIEEGVRLINENELRWWEEKLLSKLSSDWSSFSKEKGKFRMFKAKISALDLANAPQSGLQAFISEIFIPHSTPMQVFHSLYDLDARKSWDLGYLKNEVTHEFQGHPFHNEVWFTRNEVPMIKSRDFLCIRAYTMYRDLRTLFKHRLAKTDMSDAEAAKCIIPARYESREALRADAAGEIAAISYMYRSIDHHSVPENKDTLRAWSQGAAFIYRVPAPTDGLGEGLNPPDETLTQGREGCMVYFVSATDPRGSIPSFLVNTAGVSGFKDWVNKFTNHHLKMHDNSTA